MESGLGCMLNCLPNACAHAHFRGGAAHQDTGRRRNDQCRDLRDQAIANRQKGVDLEGFRYRHSVLKNTYGEAAEYVYERNEDARYCVPSDKLARSIHCAVEIGLMADQLAPPARFPVVDKTRVEVGVDAHLLSGHGVQSEPGRHLGDALRTFRDHHEIYDHQDYEYDKADHIIAARQRKCRRRE